VHSWEQDAKHKLQHIFLASTELLHPSTLQGSSALSLRLLSPVTSTSAPSNFNSCFHQLQLLFPVLNSCLQQLRYLLPGPSPPGSGGLDSCCTERVMSRAYSSHRQPTGFGAVCVTPPPHHASPSSPTSYVQTILP
jgi:hypothetical protein